MAWREIVAMHGEETALHYLLWERSFILEAMFTSKPYNCRGNYMALATGLELDIGMGWLSVETADRGPRLHGGESVTQN